jgi:hypothetical protein
MNPHFNSSLLEKSTGYSYSYSSLLLELTELVPHIHVFYLENVSFSSQEIDMQQRSPAGSGEKNNTLCFTL